MREVGFALGATGADLVIRGGGEVDLDEAMPLGRRDLAQASLPLDIGDFICFPHLVDVVSLVVEHDQVRQVLQRLQRATAQEAPVERVEGVPCVGARSEWEKALDRGLRIDLSSRGFNLGFILEKVRVFLTRQQMPVRNGDQA